MDRQAAIESNKNISPKNPMLNFLALKNLRKDYILMQQEEKTLEIEYLCLFIHHTI